MKKFIKKALLSILLIFVVVIVICTIKTITSKNNQVIVTQPAENIELDDTKIAMHLSEALKCKTISYTDPKEFDYSEFIKLHNILEKNFPNVEKSLKKQVVNNYSLLYTWEGTDKTLAPVVLAAHMDVVGIEKDTENQWKHTPFSGDIAEGKIWGRGARDNKSQVASALEAVEYLINKGFEPKRTIYLAFGHDEETLGTNGAAQIAKLLSKIGVKPLCVIDEGGAIVSKVLPGVSNNVALIRTAEKGYLTLELSVNSKGGHSSSPSKDNAIGIMSTALSNIEKYNFPRTISTMKPMFEAVASDAKFPLNVVYSNLWLTQGILNNIMESDAETAASIRTTKVATIFNSGFKDNVVPANATATINMRLMPGQTIDNAIVKIKETINDDRVKIRKIGFYNEAPKIAPTDTIGYKALQSTIASLFPNTKSVPYFSTGGTDLKHYACLTDNLYGFTPSIKEADEVGHGINERISIENYKQYIKYYVELITKLQ